MNLFESGLRLNVGNFVLQVFPVCSRDFRWEEEHLGDMILCEPAEA